MLRGAVLAPVWALVLILVGSWAAAQPLASDPGAPQTVQAAVLLTVDMDELYSQSDFGQRIATQYAADRITLAEEQSRIAEALRAEELALTEQRATMAPNVFRQEAEAFDQRARAIRAAQDAKVEGLEGTLITGRAQFIQAALPVLQDMTLERGAIALLDRRSVILSLSSVDITQEAIVRINATIGDGAPAEGADP